MQTKDNAHFFIVLVKAWIEKDGLFLLARRGHKELHMPGVWSLPGGKVEREIERGILEKTLIKEIEEEVGIKVSADMKLIYNNCFQRVDGAYVIALTFLCKYALGTPSTLEDTIEISWSSLQELKNLEGVEEFLKNDIKDLTNYLDSI